MAEASKIVVLGVGRSGTTMLYDLIYNLFKEVGISFECKYEPFLWGPRTWYGSYSEKSGHLSQINSLSIEGMYEHKNLPLFIKTNQDYKCDYLNSILTGERQKSLLVKFIRASGRINLIGKLAPECKIVYVMRNPLDVVNSSIRRFSFLEGDYMPSDWERFSEEVDSIYGTYLSLYLPNPSFVQQQLLFWHYTTRFAREALKSIPNESILLFYEDITEDYNRLVERVCDFLGIKIDHKNNFLEKLNEGVGPFTRNCYLSRVEVNVIKPFFDKYTEIAEKYLGGKPRKLDSLFWRYLDKAGQTQQNDGNRGKSPILLRNTILDKDKQLAEHDKVIKERERESKFKEQLLNKTRRILQEKQFKIGSLEDLINKKDSLIHEKEEVISNRNSLIRTKDNIILEKDKVLEDLLSRIKLFGEKAAKKENELQKKENEIGYYSNLLEKKDKIILEKEQWIRSRDEKIERFRSILQEYRKRINVNERKIAKIDEEVTEKSRLISEYEKMLKDRDQHVERLEGTIGAIEKRLSYKFCHFVFWPFRMTRQLLGGFKQEVEYKDE